MHVVNVISEYFSKLLEDVGMEVQGAAFMQAKAGMIYSMQQ